jgi:hypothetical protein
MHARICLCGCISVLVSGGRGGVSGSCPALSSKIFARMQSVHEYKIGLGWGG